MCPAGRTLLASTAQIVACRTCRPAAAGRPATWCAWQTGSMLTPRTTACASSTCRDPAPSPPAWTACPRAACRQAQSPHSRRHRRHQRLQLLAAGCIRRQPLGCPRRPRSRRGRQRAAHRRCPRPIATCPLRPRRSQAWQRRQQRTSCRRRSRVTSRGCGRSPTPRSLPSPPPARFSSRMYGPRSSC